MDAHMNRLLSEIRDRMAETWELEKETDGDQLEEFFSTMVNSLVEDYNCNPKDAQEAVKEATVRFVSLGALSQLPSEEANHKAKTEWIEEAQRIGLFGASLSLFDLAQ